MWTTLLIAVRFQENLEEFCGLDYPNKIILNKGLPIINNLCNNTRVLNLPNIGREGETYLEYMLHHAQDDTVDGYVFTQINPLHASAETKLSNLLTYVNRHGLHNRNFSCFGPLHKWRYGYGTSNTRVPSVKTDDISLFCPGATFFVSRLCVIQKLPIIRNISQELGNHQTDGWAVERSWNTLFNTC